MKTPSWDPGKLYLPGALVQPRTRPAAFSTEIVNPNFEDGSTGWTLGAGVSVDATGGFNGPKRARFSGTGGEVRVVATPEPVSPGVSISAACMYAQGAADSDRNVGYVVLRWLDGGGALVREDRGTLVRSSSGGGWKASTVSATAPEGATQVAVGCLSVRDRSDASWVDAFTWNYTIAQAPAGLIFKAVQPAAGVSGSTEPAWPATLGTQVIDNEVIWEAVLINRVVWRASPILRSGGSEPAWPTGVGNYVTDGTIKWRAVSRRVEDPKCPQSKVVAIMAGKVFAADGDIVRFSATANPLDWSSPDDAGYLPTGLQQANGNDVAVLAPYRANLATFNANGFQMWQIDPDPTAMAQLDQMEGIGSVWHDAAQPVGDELFFLSALGVRSVGVAAASTNLSAGDVGMPIDPLVQAAVAAAVTAGTRPCATYYPAAGQYWLALPDYPAEGQTRVFVFTVGQRAWSRYTFPFAIESFAQLGNVLYVRHGNAVSRIDEDALTDTGDADFSGTVQWPWLDLGGSGVTKMLEGFDIVSEGVPSVSIGYDQRDPSAYTEPYAVPADTLPGGMIPLPVSGPSMSVRVDFEPGQAWELSQVTLFLHDNRAGA